MWIAKRTTANISLSQRISRYAACHINDIPGPGIEYASARQAEIRRDTVGLLLDQIPGPPGVPRGGGQAQRSEAIP
ncbi:hypothetical protein SAMD00023353_0201960 [Rosellinia necatrix]|uniref:Uncharacterized protein n=1 Tax=Rosellinia necatrix TaxID=77044 RepID=A0A1S8A4Y1_ROSNE|nr:hypothetical protein SAMD00023353_0201960 [Rosellinia necatrix]